MSHNVDIIDVCAIQCVRNMSEKRAWDPRETEELIAIFKQCVWLWDPESPYYRDKIKTIETYDSIAKNFNTTPQEIHKKLLNLRKHFNNEWRRCRTRKCYKPGFEGVPGSSWQHFHSLLFLKSVQKNKDFNVVTKEEPGHRVPRFSTINWAVCTPSSCTSRDVEASIRHTLAKYTAQTGLKITVQIDEEMCQVLAIEPLPYKTIIVGLLFIGITMLSIIAGLCDHHSIPVSELVLAFSLKRNFLRLVSLKRTEDDIATIHGVRALNALLLLIAHKSMALFFNPYTNRTEMSECLGQPWTVIGRAASLYTDPFIMLSGLLTTYSFVGRLSKTGKLDILSEYISRLLRLVPTLGALILFCTHVMPYIGSGPQWNLVVTHHAEICKETWWRNFLFIHNYFGFENMCLTHTHHLGIDTQLFIFSPILIIFLYKKPKIGACLLVCLAIFSTILRFYVTYVKKLNNYVFFGTSIRQLFDTANLSYILPTHRLTVYIMGIFLGYILRSWSQNYQINKVTVYVGWTLSTLMWIAAFFGPAGMGSIDYVYNPIHAATYNAFAPVGWCALFAWITFLSHTGNTNVWLSKFFAWKGFLITTRLSYAIYLTQFPVFFYNVGQTRSAENYNFIRMVLNFKELFWIIATSVILTLLFDTPFQNIKNHYFKKSRSLRNVAKEAKSK